MTKQFQAVALAVAVLLALAAAGQVVGGDPAERPKIAFAYQDRIGDAVSVIAVEKGYFEKEGLAVKPLMFSTGPACTEALVSGSADFATMGDTTAVISVGRSAVTIVASHGGGEHRHRIVVKDSSPIRSPQDLIGKSVAVSKGTSTYGGFLAWARSVNLDLSQVKVTDMKPQDMGTALLSGAIDAVVASEPTPSVIEEKGGRQLATLGGLGNNYPLLLVAKNDFLKKNPDAATRFVRAMARAAEFVRDHADETAQIIAAKTGLSQAAATKAMKLHYYRVQLDEPTRASLKEIAGFLVEQKILDAAPDFSTAIDAQFLPQSETEQAKSAALTAKMRLAYGKKIHYAPQIVALKRGFFAGEGLEVEGITVQAGIQAAEAMTAGSADAGVMGDAPGIIAVSSGMPMRIVASYGGGEKMHRIVAVQDSGIHKAEDLVGKRIAVQMGSSTHGALLLYLAKNNVDVKSLKIVPLDPSNMPEAMQSGQIDAGVGSEPWPSNVMEKVKGSYELATLSGLDNNFPLVMVVTDKYATEHPEAVAAALRATQKAVDFMHEHPDEAAATISETTGVPAAKERKIMDTLEWGVVLDDATVGSLKQTADFLLNQKKIERVPDWDKVLDRSFVKP